MGLNLLGLIIAPLRPLCFPSYKLPLQCGISKRRGQCLHGVFSPFVYFDSLFSGRETILAFFSVESLAVPERTPLYLINIELCEEEGAN